MIWNVLMWAVVTAMGIGAFSGRIAIVIISLLIFLALMVTKAIYELKKPLIPDSEANPKTPERRQ